MMRGENKRMMEDTLESYALAKRVVKYFDGNNDIEELDLECDRELRDMARALISKIESWPVTYAFTRMRLQAEKGGSIKCHEYR